MQRLKHAKALMSAKAKVAHNLAGDAQHRRRLARLLLPLLAARRVDHVAHLARRARQIDADRVAHRLVRLPVQTVEQLHR